MKILIGYLFCYILYLDIQVIERHNIFYFNIYDSSFSFVWYLLTSNKNIGGAISWCFHTSALGEWKHIASCFPTHIWCKFVDQLLFDCVSINMIDWTLTMAGSSYFFRACWGQKKRSLSHVPWEFQNAMRYAVFYFIFLFNSSVQIWLLLALHPYF